MTQHTAGYERKRAAHFKQRALALQHENKKLAAEFKHQYAKGSAETMGAVYRALDSDELGMWLGSRMAACRTRKPPFKLSPDIEAIVRAEVTALLKKCGLRFDGRLPL